jgi:hypothetical protein
MAREFKQITGTITKINAPYYAEKRGLWVMMVKSNNSWVAINSRDEVKIKEYHALLEQQKAALNLNLKVQATTLEGNWLKAAEYSAGMIQQAKIADPHEMMNAVATHIKVINETKNIPTVETACDLFITKQLKRQLSHYTEKDYRRLVRELKARFGKRLVSELTSTELTAFIEELEHPVSQRARYIYLKAFMSFCGGKLNPHCEGVAWVKPGLLQWEPPKTDMHEIQVYSYDQIIQLLKRASEKKVLPYFIFRLFGMCRFDEMFRMIEIQDKIKNHPLISIENERITFSAQVYKKRSRGEHRGRFYNKVHPTFLAWLKKFSDEDASLNISEWMERAIRRTIKQEGEDRNLLRHTAITYHCIAFRNPLQTAYIAGNSVGIIQNHYLNMNIPEQDALKLYQLTPEVAKSLGIV